MERVHCAVTGPGRSSRRMAPRAGTQLCRGGYMTQPSRTTETINRDNAAIRDIMLQIRELTVPDRATLALGLIGHLATMMNRSQMAKLMDQLQEEAERVQDVPPSRQRDDERGDAREGISSEKSHAEAGN